MDPDPSLTSLKQRLELPGEIVVQLTAMKDENRRIRKDLELERRKVSRLTTAVKTMWDTLERAFPGGCTFASFHSLRFPSPLGRFEPTLISSFISTLCCRDDRVPSTLICDGVSGFSANLVSDGPIGGARNSRGAEHLGHGAWIFEFTCLSRKFGDEWGSQSWTPSVLVSSGR